MRVIIAALGVVLAACGGDESEGRVDVPVDGSVDGSVDAASDGVDDGSAACTSDVTPGPGVVVTDRGAIAGSIDAGVARYLGVPYAAPPLGALRFAAPHDVACWDGLRPAVEWGAACIQKDFQIGQSEATVVGAEDCLTLNVWAPTADAAPRPVLVFIHGGGNVSGTASQITFNQRLYDGAALAAREDVVVVTFDYRLGPFGFLVLPSTLADRSLDGNYGLGDQLMALAWVQRNIDRFGGDRARVMVFGESAGAVDTLALVASPDAAGLFSRALAESGGVQAAPIATRRAEGQAYLVAVGCGDAPDAVACLAALSLDALVAPVQNPFSGGLATGGGFGLAVGGPGLPEDPLAAIRAGHHNRVAFAIGANAEETRIVVPAGSVTPQKVRLAFESLGEPYTSELLGLYPPGATPAEARESWIRVTTDAQFVCGSRRIARAVRAHGDVPVWRYFFTHTAPPSAGGQNGAFHGLELFYVFGVVERIFGGVVARDEDRAVVAAMMGYWARFAASGDPNGAGAVAWPAYTVEADDYLELAAPPVAGAGIRGAECDVWDALAAAQTP